MAVITGTDEEVLAVVQRIVAAAVPDAVCELQDYRHRIGCGTHDASGKTQEVVMLRRQLEEDEVRHHAEALRIKVATGGSTASS